MGILDRFSDIIKANINSVIDRMEDPEKMIDQYLRNMMDDLAEVKNSTAGVMAEEVRTKRRVDENEAEVKKFDEFARRAITAGNDDDAKIFIAKKQELEATGAGLATAYAAAHENAVKMRQMHDKLVKDIDTLRGRREMIKAKVSVARTQETLNRTASTADGSQSAMDAFSRMEDKASRLLDTANAKAELNMEPIDEAKQLEEKYASNGSASVDAELEELKKQLGKGNDEA